MDRKSGGADESNSENFGKHTCCRLPFGLQCDRRGNVAKNCGHHVAPRGYCSLKRDGQVIATVPQTPAEVTVDKTKDDILINCVVAGYQPTSQYLHSGIATGTYGNIIAGGLVGWGVDSMTGADNEYPATVSLNMSSLPKDEAPASVAFVQAAPTPCTKEQADLKRLAQEQGYRFQANCY